MKKDKTIKYSTHMKHIGKLEKEIELLKLSINAYTRHEKNFRELEGISKTLKDNYEWYKRQNDHDINSLHDRINELTRFCLETFRIAEEWQRDYKK